MRSERAAELLLPHFTHQETGEDVLSANYQEQAKTKQSNKVSKLQQNHQ